MEFITAGESHGPACTAIVSGVPAGIPLSEKAINADLARRQHGYGRGGRMAIETDTARITGGVRFSHTLGSPVCLVVENSDHANWTGRMDVFGEPPVDLVRETTPRPGHADLVGMLRTGTDDARNILERSSARETAARVAAGTVAKALLAELGVEVASYVRRIGDAAMPDDAVFDLAASETSVCRCPDAETTDAMRAAIDAAREAGESLGGEFTVVVTGLVPGLGSYASGPARLTAALGGAIFAIPAVKAVEFGLGHRAAWMSGSSYHDEITYAAGAGYGRASNNAGGLEGGMTTGQPLVITAVMKPIPTLRTPLMTVNTDTHEPAEASKERSDVCAVPACAVVAEAEVAMVLADAYTRLLGDANLADMKAALAAYRLRIAGM